MAVDNPNKLLIYERYTSQEYLEQVGRLQLGVAMLPPSRR